MSTSPKVSITSDMASYGADWNEYGTRHQLVHVRDSHRVTMHVNAGTGWVPVTVSEPERFGALPIKSGKAWAAYVAAFLAPLED